MYWIQKIGHCVKFEAAAREIKLVVDRDKFDEEEKLDGCYVLKTELAKELASNEIIEQR
ncbi:MAG: hypothetical protein HYV28_19620 [Ignavibacteriales bacterium]|nr:hypothetical protein [Ignavibacteriales bacterium]